MAKVAYIRDYYSTLQEEGYDPDRTPDIIFGFLLVGYGIEQIAASLGIAPEVLRGWMGTIPEVQKACVRAACAPAEIAAALYKLCVGWTDPKGRHYPPSLPAIKLYMKTFGVEPGGKEKDEPGRGNTSDEERHRLAREILDEIENKTPVPIGKGR